MTARTLALPAVVAVVAGAGASVALADRDHPEDDGTTTTTTTTTTGTTGTTTGTTTAPTTTAPVSRPRLVEGEVDDAPGRRIRLRVETAGRVTAVRFRYRGRSYRAQRTRSAWVRTVTARNGDHLDDRVVTFRATACAGGRCTTRTFRDEA